MTEEQKQNCIYREIKSDCVRSGQTLTELLFYSGEQSRRSSPEDRNELVDDAVDARDEDVSDDGVADRTDVVGEQGLDQLADLFNKQLNYK